MASQTAFRWTLKKKLLLTAGIFLLLGIIVVGCIFGLYAAKRQEDTKKWKGSGTTKNLKEIVLGRCYNYLAIHPGIGEKDCNGIWEAFSNAVYQKDPCNITVEDYNHLAELASQSMPCNKSLLWSKTNYLVHRYTKSTQDYITLEDTFLGYMFDGLTWCGKYFSSGMNSDSCPAWNECDNNSVSSFWKKASATFARSSCGVVNVMLNGSAEGGIARKESILRTVEIPGMNRRTVTEVRLWVIDNIDGPDRNSCDTESLQELKHYIEEYKLAYSCIDNYSPVRLLQCTENPAQPGCKFCS